MWWGEGAAYVVSSIEVRKRLVEKRLMGSWTEASIVVQPSRIATDVVVEMNLKLVAKNRLLK